LGLLARTKVALRHALRRLVMRNPFKFLPEELLARLLVASAVFDWKWYVVRAGAPAQSALDAARAYVRRADAADAPNPLFDADWYRLLYGFHGTPAEALLHFRFIGERFGLQPSPWFHNRAYRLQSRMSLRFGSSLARFQRDWREMHTGHPLFDLRWYVKTYADSAASGENPLVHFVVHGRHQGRLPNRYFSPQWYLKQYTDVAVAGWEPIQHYFEHGAAECRSPGPDFDAHAYADAHPEQRLSGLDPLGHFLVVGRAKGFTNERRALPVAALVRTPKALRSVPPARGVVDIILPVYRGLEETRDCIESVLRSTNRVPTRLRIYNDASPEPAVTRYLRSVAEDTPGLILVENEENLGFVGTVNRGMRAALAEPDSAAVLLLNSDTVVAGDWVDRMLWHAMASPRVGSVTAMSNNATICSYPRLGENEMPAGRSVAQMDAAAALANPRQSVEIPTAVGFCMLIERRALENVGLFDEDAFGKGYGEENDFCMRASAVGFRHLLALDVFVRHVGEVSFATTSKPGKLTAERVIAERYPYYAGLVSDWVRRDPSQSARLRLTFALWRLSREDVHVIVTHDLGGGTERQVQRLAERLGEVGHVVIVRPVHGRSARLKLEATSAVDGFTIEVDVEDGAGLAALLKTMGVTSVQIHHLLGHGELIRDGLARSGLGHEFFVHDYFTVCPQVTLTTARATYCGEPGPAGCDACIRERPSHGASDIRNWRLAHEWAVRGATAVKAPSEDTARRIERYFGVLPEVCPHESLGVMQSKPFAKRPATHRRPLRVVLVGVLAAHKGRDLVMDAATAAQRKQLPLTFHLIGDTQGPVPSSASRKLSATGWYEEAQLSRLIAEAAPDVFLFPAPWPETYSFTLTAAMETGLPIVATELGAFIERLQPYAAGRMVPPGITGAALADQLVEWFVEKA
jgi:GT2 family glycosyltransferase